jgi:asparagine synthase (glutamine-hydrolysing)
VCGIIGQISSNAISQKQFCLKRDTLQHRGPDGKGAVFLQNDTIALGHTRLSFFDLSENGKQPMTDASNSLWITFNGEIYNFREIKKELTQLGKIFHTETDTEVILEGYKVWGIKIVDKLKGMFAFALLDLDTQKLFLVRDRFGIKPLYFSMQNNDFIFASELKAIVKNSDFKYEIDFSSFADYFTYRYIPSPKTIWKNISKLPPAHFLEYNITSSEYKVIEYWKLNYLAKTIAKEELATEYGKKLEQSVLLHACADVPIGSFLSGGYDSSAIAYFLAKNNYLPETFSIGFENWNNSEDRFASMVSEKYGLIHHSLIVSDNDLNLVDMMPKVYDEPIADISILPTFLVSKNARKYVKAVMGGEGADELLGGYTWQKDWYNNHQSSWLQNLLGEKKVTSDNVISYYSNAMAMGFFDTTEQKKLLNPQYHHLLAEDSNWFYKKNLREDLSSYQAIQQMDIKCFMGELVLTKIDRASMANSLEVRVPFLDHELFELVLTYKEKCYIEKDTTKYLLYQNIKDALPKEILQRKKQGFVGPDSFYMNMQWYECNLKNATLIKEGIVNEEYYLQLLTRKEHWKLWKLLVMEKWFNHWAY